jgi:hypothetical protein
MDTQMRSEGESLISKRFDRPCLGKLARVGKAMGPASSVLMAAILTAAMAGASRDRPGGEQREDSAHFKEFNERVQEYVRLRESLESELPPLKSKDEESPDVILARQKALATKIRKARSIARAGDIFAQETREAFRHALRSVFEGPSAAEARSLLRQDPPARTVHLQVNEAYPAEVIPYTTVPPSLLLQLPQLPDEVAYAIVGRDLILLDVKANMVVDVLPEILPAGGN